MEIKASKLQDLRSGGEETLGEGKKKRRESILYARFTIKVVITRIPTGREEKGRGAERVEAAASDLSGECNAIMSLNYERKVVLSRGVGWQDTEGNADLGVTSFWEVGWGD